MGNIIGETRYRKIPKISLGAYIFQRPLLRGLFFEGPIFGGAYVQRKICVSKSIGLACSGKEIYHFCFVLLCIRGQIPSTSPLGDLYLEGRFNGGFFLRYDLGGPIFGGAYFQNFTVANLVYSYFEKGCQIECTRQPRKVLWVVHCFSKKFDRMAGEAMDMSVSAKESNKSRFDRYSVRNSVLNISHITFRDCRVHIFPTTFLEIAVG